jgi:hypothetical protein
MKKIFTTVLAFLALKSAILAQTATAVPVVTLTGGPNTPMEVAFNPTANLYYASSGGGGCNTLATYSLGGGASFTTVSECYDSRGLWWNSLTNVLEGNSFNSAGIYTMALTGGGVPTGAGAIAAANSQPNSQTGGQFDPTTNQVLYYNGAMGIAKYNRVAPGALISTIAITGLPGGIGSIATYGFYTGVPGSEYGIYDYTNRRAYLINYITGAYVATVQFPPSAGAPGSYNLSYTNGLYFICNAGTWVGYTACTRIISNPVNAPVCSGTSFSLTAIGATNYTWSTGAVTSSIVVTPTANANYSVVSTPTFVGCASNTAAISMTVNPSPTVAVSGNTLICGTGTNVLTASGANTYSWSNGAATASISASPTITTTYTVVGTSTAVGSCTNSQTVSIIVSTNPTVAVAGPTTAVCAGSPFTLTASGAASYSWNNGAATSTIAPTPTANASYTVVGTNTAGCSSNAVTSVTVNAVPSVSVAGAGTICAGNSTVLTASGANTYSWNTGATTSTISVSPIVNTTYTAMGTSSVTGCTGMVTANIVVSPCTGINQLVVKSSEFTVYPNPSNGEFTIEISNGINKIIEISDLTGRIVSKNTSVTDKVNVNISNLANGIYYVKIQSSNAVEVIKIVKQ